MYAGQNGYPTHQGAAAQRQFAPRGGVAWSLTDKTVIRGGYGLFWAPTQFPGVTEAVIGTRGYTASTSFLSSNDGGLTPAGSLSNPFPAGVTPAAGQLAGPADRRRRRHRLRRSEREARLRPAVLGRLPVGTAGRQRRQRRLHGQPVRAAEHGRDERRHGQHQPARSAVPLARHGAAATGAESVLRQRRVRQPEPLARRSRAASCCVRFRSSRDVLAHRVERGPRALQRPRRQVGSPDEQRLGRVGATTPTAD